ncbi:hypothetical protein JMJ55_09190 [Belnapia sp. T6]|uniref:Uncharacterized protein n=1 Tax=Belnapia mucosa TaxID=2804532 RepID=A0ABS1V2Z1_9PROT|nr:hypothetical protein [Belnapia mucosa]MBL6455496.1 hypothetical protein [Belnapia mucosa]
MVTIVPYVEMVVSVPFWMASSPRPLNRERRVRLLRHAAQALRQTEGAVAIAWEVCELASSSNPMEVAPPRLWHPANMTQQKGAVLVGHVDAVAEPMLDCLRLASPAPAPQVSLLARRILLYDHGLGVVEYGIAFDGRGTAAAAGLLDDADYWARIRAAASAVLAERRLGILDSGPWNREMTRLQQAFEQVTQSECGTGWTVPIAELFWDRDAAQANAPAYLFSEYSVNFLLFDAAGPEDGGNAHGAAVTRTVLGRQLVRVDASQGRFSDYRAASPHLSHVVHGAINSLVVLHGQPGEPDAERLREAVRSLLRIAWLKYGALREASDGLLAKQIEWGFGSGDRACGIRETSRRIGNLHQVEQLSRIMLAEFEPSRFWDTELEQDIYHRSHELWDMPSVERVFREQLVSVAAIERELHRQNEVRRSRLLQWIISGIGLLTLVSTVNDYVELSTRSESKILDFPIGTTNLTHTLLLLLVLGLFLSWRLTPRGGTN